nr:MAG TPA: hypothetical protein [Caudoviricetes sp.]
MAGGQRFWCLCDWSDACVCQFFCQFSGRSGKWRKRYCTRAPNFASFGAICQF